MAKTDLNIPSLGDKFVDLRDQLPGDSYNFSWVRPLSQVNYLAIHHTAAPNTQTPQEIANDHINNNGWGGIGYHFLISSDGVVFYVGDISTARANVANLNEQVLGICLMGNFTQGQVPTNQQLDSAHKLCEFFIVSYPDLPNVKSWDKVRGHKELPNQSTPCPGDDWNTWRIQIVEGIKLTEVESQIEEAGDATDNRSEMLRSQVDSLQASLTSVNQQVIFLQGTVQEREQEITRFKQGFKIDTTLTLTQALINLYKFVFPPGKES